MPKRFIFLWTIPLFFSTSLYAQLQDASPSAERTLWDHNGSIMYLIAIGSSRELHYQKPRPGMLEAGAHPDDVLFKGEINDGQISGTAYIFNAQCGQVPFHVKGPILDNGGRIVLTGQAPRIGRNCQTLGDYTSTLEFRLLKTSEVAQPSPATAQAPNVEEPTREPPPSDAAEPNLSNNSSAQPARTRQTPWIEDRWPKTPPSGTMDPHLHGNLSAQTSPAAQPNIEGPKSCRRRDNGYHSISSAVAYNLGSHSPKKFYRRESSSAYNHCAERGASVLIHIILDHDAQIERMRHRLRNRYFKLVSLTIQRERTKLR